MRIEKGKILKKCTFAKKNNIVSTFFVQLFRYFQNGGEILALGTICMYTHDSTGRKAILTGWLASQSDMLLEDWNIVE